MIISNNNLSILVPNLPESVADATVAVWRKKEGDLVRQDEILVEIETDKIMLEVPASEEGILEVILEQEGSIVKSGQILGHLKLINDCSNVQLDLNNINTITQISTFKQSNDFSESLTQSNTKPGNDHNIKNDLISPAVRKLILESNLDITSIKGSGIKGRVTRQDVEKYIQHKQSFKKSDIDNNSNKCEEKKLYLSNEISNKNIVKDNSHRKETRVVMSRLRQTVSERLLSVTQSTAMLTTFNEVNMQSVIILRNKYKELFEKKYNVKLGFMSFYVKSVLEGLRRFPAINASIDGNEIVYYNYFDISIAISTDKGLVTPVLRDVDRLKIADIEEKIRDLAKKGKDGKLTIEELIGGNFTITNGGVFGSMMSTPIINPPQSAILGMHAIKERPVALDGKIVILPMMYLALSYDHRLIDGKDSVNFLATIKELIEDPVRLLLDL